jgi:hypothetical protein
MSEIRNLVALFLKVISSAPARESSHAFRSCTRVRMGLREGAPSEPPFWPGPSLVLHPSQRRQRRRRLRLPPIDVAREFLMGLRQPPEGRGRATTRHRAGKNAEGSGRLTTDRGEPAA